jgi:hypothetical protein
MSLSDSNVVSGGASAELCAVQQGGLRPKRTVWLQGGHLEDAGCWVARGAQRRMVAQHPPPGTPRILRHGAVPHLRNHRPFLGLPTHMVPCFSSCKLICKQADRDS